MHGNQDPLPGGLDTRSLSFLLDIGDIRTRWQVAMQRSPTVEEVKLLQDLADFLLAANLLDCAGLPSNKNTVDSLLVRSLSSRVQVDAMLGGLLSVLSDIQTISLAEESVVHWIAKSDQEIVDLSKEFKLSLDKQVQRCAQGSRKILLLTDLDFLQEKDVMGSDAARMFDQILFRWRESSHDADRWLMVAGTCVDDGKSRWTNMFAKKVTVDAPSPESRLAWIQSRKVPWTFGTDEEEEEFQRELVMKTNGYALEDLERLFMDAVDCDLHGSAASLWKEVEAMSSTIASTSSKYLTPMTASQCKAIAGYQSLQARLNRIVTWPFTKKKQFEQLGMAPYRGVLLFGYPGCGKTQLALSMAKYSTVLELKTSELLSMYIGESEQRVREIFVQARKLAPCILFIDQLEQLGGKRDWQEGNEAGGVDERVLITLLNEMDGIEMCSDVLVVGCTSRPDRIDDALLRQGRMDQLVFVSKPTLQDRADILESLLQRTPLVWNVNIKELASAMERWTGADVEALIREAQLVCLRSPETGTIDDVLLRKLIQEMEPAILRRNAYHTQLAAIYQRYHRRN